MAKDFISAVPVSQGVVSPNQDELTVVVDTNRRYQNTMVIESQNKDQLGLVQRHIMYTISTANVDGTSVGRGVATIDGNLVWVIDDTYYFGTSGGFGLTMDAVSPEYNASLFISDNVGLPLITIVNPGSPDELVDGSMYFSFDTDTLPTKITDANAPFNNNISICSGGCSISGYTFVGTYGGFIYNSNLDDITTWTATDFINTEKTTSTMSWLGRHKDHVVTFSRDSIQFFYLDPSNSVGSPLSPRTDLSYNIGLLSPNAICVVGDVIYFLGQSYDNEVSVYKLENFSLQEIPIPVIKQRFSNQTTGMKDTPSNRGVALYELNARTTRLAYAVPRQTNRPTLYFYTSRGTDTMSLLIDLQTLVFSDIRSSENPVGHTDWTEGIPVVAGAGSELQLGNGTIATTVPAYEDRAVDLNFSTDFTSHAILPKWDKSTYQRKRIHNISPLINPGEQAVSANPGTISISMRRTDESESSFGAARTTSGIIAGKKLTRWGEVRQAEFKVELNGNMPFLGLEIDYDILGN